jgi:predicted aldo/keto reductase-like oxidoreductase
MDEALETLGVDGVDIAFFNIHDAGEVHDSKYREGAERWRKMGKFKYIGLTSHKEVPECMEAGLDEGFYDVLMPAYDISQEERFLPIFARAQKEGVGVVLMKTKRGVNGVYEEVVPHYLATTGITTIVKAVDSFSDITNLIEASKKEPDQQAGIRIRKSAQTAMSGHCRMCGSCTSSCPKGLPVSDVVRCSDYYLEYTEHVETAFETYRGLGRRPLMSVCGNCAVCEQSCPNQVPVLHHLRRAERALA